MFKVDVSPDMAMYHLLRNQGYDPAYALAEFVDNALQAHLSRPLQEREEVGALEVTITFHSDTARHAPLRNSIVIEDSGPGISRDRLNYAMKPAYTSGARGLSEFGIGMKAAAVWFTDNWTLSTVPVGDSRRYSFAFDLPALLTSNNDTVEVEDAKCSAASGTVITLKGLRRRIDLEHYKQICDDLRQIYQRFTEGNSPRMKLTAKWDDVPTNLAFDGTALRNTLHAPRHKRVREKQYAIGPARTWNVPINTTFMGAPITGFISLLTTGSYKDNPGLVMFRGERVVQGTTRKPNLPRLLFATSNKYARQRVYGELLVDGLPVTYTKDRFEINEDDFAKVLKAAPDVVELIAQAESYRVRETDVIAVKKESDIPGVKVPPKAKPAHPSPPPTGTSSAQPPSSTVTSVATTKPEPTRARPLVQPQPMEVVLNDIRLKTQLLALQNLIDEALILYRMGRNIGAAMCMRLILELGVLDKIRRKNPNEYTRVAGKGIKAVLDYMHSNQPAFFDKRADHRVIKCVQSIANSTLGDVVLLNNVAHGHFQPDRAQLNNFAVNLQPLFVWAFEPQAKP